MENKEWTLFGFNFNGKTKVKVLLDRFPWLLKLNSDLKKAANFGLSIESVQKIAKLDDNYIDNLINQAHTIYNEDGSYKQN